MGYDLRAIIAAEAVLRGLKFDADVHIAELEQGLAMVPMVGDGPFDDDAAPKLPGFVLATQAMAERCAQADGPVAYVESDYFGGVGEQTAIVWQDGEAVLGPLHLPAGDRLPKDGGPISKALRRLGAIKGHHYDEFEAVGLQRHRHTEDWLRD